MLPEQIGNRPFCIYGAGIVASSVYTVLKELYHMLPAFFLISDENGGNEPEEIDGIPVKRLSSWVNELRDGIYAIHIFYYIIAVPEPHHAAVIRSLQETDVLRIGASRMLRITGAEENALMEAYYGGFLNCRTVSKLTAGKQSAAVDGRVVCGTEKECRIQVFQVKSHKDRLLHSQRQKLPEYINPIQAGAALTDQVIAEIQDNRGDHISEKNGNYSELTATYYAWKNSRAAYKGICHYRRFFEISEEQMQTLLSEEAEWDVILPYPTVHYPDITAQHLRYLREEDWNALLLALQETSPDYLAAFEKMRMDGGQRFFNFNMLIAKAAVFDNYCSFLFRVLGRAEALVTSGDRERLDRFAGYMGENLTTIYFLKNRDKLKIVYAGKRWLT